MRAGGDPVHGQVLVKGAAERDVQELVTAAYAENWDPRAEGGAQRAQVGQVAPQIGSVEGGPRSLPV